MTDKASKPQANRRRRQQAQQPPPQQEAPPQSNDNANNNRGRGSFTFSAVLIFLGSLLGTLIGTFTSIDDMFNSFSRIEQIINPPARLCVAGSNTILGEGLGMAAEWETQFELLNEDIDVDVNPTGSVDGVRLAGEGGCVNVLAMSEALTPGQKTLLDDANVDIQCAVEIGYDIIAFVTNSNNDLSVLLERLMGNILVGRYTNWEQVRGSDETIYIYARPGSGTTDYVLRQFDWELGERLFPPNANYIECDSNSDCLDRTLSTPGALYWVSTSWMRTQPPQYLRVLPILRGDERAINPLRDTFDIREYPSKLIRPLYMYVLDTGETDTETLENSLRFLRFVRGVDGQQVLESNYFFNHFNRPEGVELEFPDGFSEEVSGPRQLCKSF